MKNRNKILLTSILTIFMCASLIAGGTFALFTNKSDVSISVTSAKVDVFATVDSNLTYYSAKKADEGATIYDENGKGYTQPEVIGSWTNGGTASFNEGMLTLTNITPGDKVGFNIALINKSTVKIQYRTVVMLKAESDVEVADLAKVLVISKDGEQIYSGNTDPTKDIIYTTPEMDKFYSPWTNVTEIPENPSVGKKIDADSTLEGQQDVRMTVELPITINNYYQGKDCKLYFVVEAVQYNANTENEVVTTVVKNDLEAINDSLLSSSAVNNTMYDALVEAKAAIIANGLESHFVGCLAPEMDDFKANDGREFAWDSINDQFLLMNGDAIIYPIGTNIDKVAIFKLSNCGISEDGYSLYLTKDYNGGSSLVVATGLDVGVNENIESITYERSGELAQEVIIRTNGGTITIDSALDVVLHHGLSEVVYINETAQHSYHEYGTVRCAIVKKGHIILEKPAKVDTMHFVAKDTDSNNIKDAFEPIQISYDSSVSLPKFSRDVVEIDKENGTLVVELTEDLDVPVSDYVWLWDYGIFQQIRVTNSSNDCTTDFGYANDENQKERTSKAAFDICNNWAGDSIVWVDTQDTPKTERVIDCTPQEASEKIIERGKSEEKAIEDSKPNSCPQVIKDNLNISSPEGVNILEDGYKFGITKDDILNLVGDNPEEFNKLIHGAKFVPGDASSSDKLILHNCRIYEAKNADGYNAENGKYKNWHGDFVVSFNRTVNAVDMSNGTGLILCGCYGDWGWLKIPVDKKIEAGQEYRLLNDYMGGLISINYEELCTVVKKFQCGAVYAENNYDASISPLIMTIEFRMYETYSEADAEVISGQKTVNAETGNYVIVDSYIYTFN